MTGHPYLSRQIIAYIGNKRRLLPLIGDAMDRFFGPSSDGALFYDLFAGSGVVSRLARLRGFRVVANDWEPYSRVLSSAWLSNTPTGAEALFAPFGGMRKVLHRLNTLPSLPSEQGYIAHYYSAGTPDPDKADWKSHRLFYTLENGQRIDRIRAFIDNGFPPDPNNPDQQKRRDLLIGLLLYEAATHVNTSGVFKAFHRGFGGHGKDALKRILGPIELEEPVLVDSPWPSGVLCRDAADAAAELSENEADLVYLDPPYNQHQYGSNYHLLNTIALWDSPPAALDRNSRGELLRKGGIRGDWIRTRSPYCSRSGAEKALEDLLRQIRARRILLSYSSDGIIPFDTLRDICRRKGRLSLHTGEYVTYRGGRQSATRRISNIEFLLVIEPGHSGTSRDQKEIDRILLLRKLGLLFRRRFRYGEPGGPGSPTAVTLSEGTRITLIPAAPLEWHLPEGLDRLSVRDLAELVRIMESALPQTAVEELEDLERWRDNFRDYPSAQMVRAVLQLLRRLAHPRYRQDFELWLDKTRRDPLFASPAESERLGKLALQAAKRLSKSGLDGPSEAGYNG